MQIVRFRLEEMEILGQPEESQPLLRIMRNSRNVFLSFAYFLIAKFLFPPQPFYFPGQSLNLLQPFDCQKVQRSV